MGYTHLNITERSQLEILLRLGWSNRAIGKELGRHHSAKVIKKTNYYNKRFVSIQPTTWFTLYK